MTNIDEILEFNKKFVEDKAYMKYATTKYPDKKIAILSCMDTRLTEILPAALNLKNGDVKLIKNAGAIIINPYGSVMRSILVAIYALGVEDVLIIAHHDCGMRGLEAANLLEKIKERGISREIIDSVKNSGIDISNWLKGFDETEDSVKETVKIVKNHPLLPKDIGVFGFIIDPVTGKLDTVV
jgi:carbonic anhydrase